MCSIACQCHSLPAHATLGSALYAFRPPISYCHTVAIPSYLLASCNAICAGISGCARRNPKYHNRSRVGTLPGVPGRPVLPSPPSRSAVPGVPGKAFPALPAVPGRPIPGRPVLPSPPSRSAVPGVPADRLTVDASAPDMTLWPYRARLSPLNLHWHITAYVSRDSHIERWRYYAHLR